MNIFYVIFSFTVGGIEKLLIDIMNEIDNRTNNKVYLCIINNHYDTELLKKINPNIEIILLNRKKGKKDLYSVFKYTKLILKNKVDVIHCQGINTVKFSIIAKILRPSLRIYNTVHDSKVYLKLKNYEVILDKIMCKKIVAISDKVKSEIVSRGIKSEKVERIYNSINFKGFPKSERKLYKENIVIGNVARIMPEKKGQDILIRAINELKMTYPNIQCNFAGAPANNNNNYLENLKALVSELELQDNINFLGNVMDISKFLDEVDIYVMPSRYEGFGISLIEAMAKGIPCIASDIDGPKEIIKNNEYGLLFKNEDYLDLVDKINYLIKFSDKFDRKKVVDYVKNNYDIACMVDKLLLLYK